MDNPPLPLPSGSVGAVDTGVSSLDASQRAIAFLSPSFLVLRKPSDFRKLRRGFPRLRAVSFVSSPDLILRLFEQEGFREVDLIVGSEHKLLKEALIHKGVSTLERLEGLVRSGSLKILVPKGNLVIHTKFYLLEGEGTTRVVVGSVNLTDSSQMNTVHVTDYLAGDPGIREAEAVYELHRTECEPFLGDLFERCRGLEAEERKRVLARWIEDGGEVGSSQDAEVGIAIYRSLLAAPEASQPIVQLEPPPSPNARKKYERLISPAIVGREGSRLSVRWDRYLSVLRQTTPGFPLLVVAMEEGRIEMPEHPLEHRTRMAPLPTPREVDEALQNLEDYCDSVDLARSSNPEFDKRVLLEGILYVLYSPFAHEYMTARRQRFGLADLRGPRFLYVYGPSHNGKSTFLTYALKLVAGDIVRPADAKSFREGVINNARHIGSVFPLAFDDVAIPKRGGLTAALKSYWESWWRPDLPQSQIILVSNSAAIENWAKTRVKRLDFMFQFPPSAEAKERLGRIMAFNNRLFPWFAHLYRQKWMEGAWAGVSDADELFLARDVLTGLYGHAGRKVPAYFPHSPVEVSAERAKRRWRGLLFDVKPAKAVLRQGADYVLVEFAGDVQPDEIDSYLGDLPAEVSPEKTGNRIQVRPPDVFLGFLGERSGTLLSRLSRALRRGRRGNRAP